MAGQEKSQNQLTKLMIPVVFFLFAITDWTPFLQPSAGENETSYEEGTSQNQPFFAEQERLPEEGSASLGEDQPLIEKPLKGDIVRVIKQVNVLRCAEAEEERFTGKVFIYFNVMNTGQVASARALPPIKDTPMGDCLEAEAKKLKFPRFKQESISFKFPFVVL